MSEAAVIVGPVAIVAFEIWAGVALILALGSCALAGWRGYRGYHDPVGLVIISAMWPAFAVSALVIAPFWTAYKLGRLVHRTIDP